MAGIAGNGRLMIRKRAAPNIHRKKENVASQLSSNQDLKVESVASLSEVTASEKEPFTLTAETQVIISDSNNPPSLPDDASHSVKSEPLPLNDEKAGSLTVEQSCQSNDSKFCLASETQSSSIAIDSIPSGILPQKEEVARNNHGIDSTVDPIVSSNDTKFNSNFIVSTGKQLKKRSAPVLPKKRVQPSLPNSTFETHACKEGKLQRVESNVEVDFNKNAIDQIKTSTVQTNEVTPTADVDTDIPSDKHLTCDSISNDSCSKVSTLADVQISDSSKIALKKRATPILSRKRPLANHSHAISLTINRGTQESLVDTTRDVQKIDLPAEKVSDVEQSKQLLEFNLLAVPQNPPAIISVECNKSDQLSQQGIQFSDKKQNELHREETQLVKEHGFDLECETAVKKIKIQDNSYSILGQNKLENNSKGQLVSSNNNFIKRRVGPKLNKAVTTKPSTFIENDSNAVTGTSDNTSIQSMETTSTDSTKMKCSFVERIKFSSSEGNDISSIESPMDEGNISCQKSIHKIVDDLPQANSVSQSTSEVASTSKNQETGVVRVFLDCWPQYPLNNLKDDPFCKERNIKELGKMCIFTKNKSRIAYCDTKSTVDFKDDNEEREHSVSNEHIESSNQDYFNSTDAEELLRCNDFSFSDNGSEEVNNKSDSLNMESQLIETKLARETENVSESCEKVTLVVNDPIMCESNQSQCHSMSDINVSEPLERGADSTEKVNDNDSLLVDKGDQEPKTEELNKAIVNKHLNHCEAKQLENSSSKKPYKLRKAKPLSVKNYEDVDLDDVNNVVDIFSNSEDSDVSVFDSEIKTGPALKRKRTLKIKNKRSKKSCEKKLIKAKSPKKNITKKNTVKKEKQKKSVENVSSFCKLQNQVKNKKKWDEDGNCDEPEKLELKDFIFYIPKNEPMMSQEKKEVKTVINSLEANEKEEEKEDEENHGPKLIVKDGKIVVDPNSTKIKQTPVMHFKAEKWEKPKEVSDPWDLQETMKFYASLWKYGIDYSVLAGSFPKKSRDSLKKKFSYEEKYNGTLLVKALTKKLTLEAVLREVILIDSLEKLCRKKKNSEDSSKKLDKQLKKQPKHCLLQKRKKTNKNNSDKNTKQSKTEHFVSENYDNETDNQKQWVEGNEVIISEDVNNINLNDVITFSTNVVYKNMNIVESVSFHPSAIQPVDINVTICHEPEPAPVTEDTSLK